MPRTRGRRSSAASSAIDCQLASRLPSLTSRISAARPASTARRRETSSGRAAAPLKTGITTDTASGGSLGERPGAAAGRSLMAGGSYPPSPQQALSARLSQMNNVNITPLLLEVFRHQAAVAMVRPILTTEQAAVRDQLSWHRLLDTPLLH